MKSEAPQALRSKILHEAIGLLYREGVDRITMRALAEKLGYSAATIYLYFKNKDELVREIAMYGFERLAEASRPALAIEDPAEAVKEAGRRYIDFGLSNRELYRLMFQEFSVAGYEGTATVERAGQTWELYRKLYRRGMDAGVFRECAPDLQVAMAWAMFHGFVMLALADRMPPRQTASTPLLALRDEILEDRIRVLRP